jgi:MFS family permease
LSRFTTLVVLLGGVAILLLGNGLFGTLLGIRANIENFGAASTGLIMSAYFLGYAVGSYLCVQAINGVGHIRTFAALSATLAATAIAHAIFVDPVVWGLFRLVAGVCIVGVFLVIESWLNFMTPPPMRGRVFSIYMMVNLLAMASGQFLLMVASPGDFVLFGIVSILFALSLLPTSLSCFGRAGARPSSWAQPFS